MKSLSTFNGLNGATVTRNEVEKLIELAKCEEQTDVIYRLSKVLNDYPKSKEFDFEIDRPATEQVPVSFLRGLDYIYEPLENLGLGKAVSASEIYDMITNKMLDLISAANKGDYKRAWKEEGYTVPYNFISKKAYRGVNAFMLAPFFELLDNPYYLTFKQVKDLGGSVKKGSHGHEVVYFSTFDKKYTDAEIERINSVVENIDGAKSVEKGDSRTNFFLKYYNVFNGADIEGIDFDLDNFKLAGKLIPDTDIDGKDNQKFELAEAIVENYPSPKPPIYFQGSKAFYSPGKDSVTVPKMTAFESSQSFYRTLLHELSHSTGHESRLKRDFSGQFGSKEYAFEELIAEFGAVFLSAQAGIMFYTNKNHAGYLKGWNDVLVPQLENDNKFLMKAASQAQKLADFVLQPDANGEFLFMKNGKKDVEKVVAKTKKVTEQTLKNGSFHRIFAIKRNGDKTEDFDSIKTQKEAEIVYNKLRKDLNNEIIDWAIETYRNNIVISVKSVKMETFPDGKDNRETIKKPIAKKVVAPKKVIPKNKFGKNELVKVIYGECKNHIGKVTHCSYDEENGIFYYDVENACKDEISENNLAVATVLKTVAKKVVAKKVVTNQIVGYALLDSISSETIATKKTLPELKTVWQNLSENEIGKGTEIFVYEIISKLGKNVMGKRVDVIWIRETPPEPNKKTISKSATGFYEVAISDIKTDTARFQNRNKLNENVLNQIVENYSDTKMDPIIVWIDKDKKTYLLAGHHRFEATKRVGRKTIAAKYFQGTEAEAIKYAKLESNANRSLELPQERAKLYREMITNGATKTAVSNEAKKLEGKNANYILNLSYLQPKGVTISALDQLSETGDKQNATLIEKIADWSGEARRNNDELTNQHEKEIFDFLMDREASKRINSKSEFLQKIVAATGMYFDYETALNLKRFKNQTEGETVYDAEYNELKNKIDSIVANRLDLIDRIKNPSNKNYINPAKEKDYEAILTALDKAILKYNVELKLTQAKLIELSRKKGSYTNAGSNQAGLFGVKNDAWFPKYLQFKDKPKEAIKHLLKVKKGDCISALYRDDIGYIDIVWGENDSNNKGFGLKHIVEKHGKEIASLGYKIEDFLPIIVHFGDLSISNKDEEKIILESKTFRVVLISKEKKQFVLSAFDLRPLSKKQGLKGVLEEINLEKLRKHNKSDDGAGFTMLPLYGKTSILKDKDTKKGLGMTLAEKRKQPQQAHEYYKIDNRDISTFLGKIEKKNKESVVITLAGGQGSGKTRMLFQLMNAFAQNYKCGHASIEEHPESALYNDKVDKYLNTKAQQNITSPEIENVSDLERLILDNDVIFIDSFAKLQEIENRFEVDKDLRKKYDGKLFVIIFQQTTDGKMRGGSKSQFDGDIILLTQPFPNYQDNYIYPNKNRYNSIPLDELKLNIYTGKLIIKEVAKVATHNKFSFVVN